MHTVTCDGIDPLHMCIIQISWNCSYIFPYTWRAGTTVEGAHGVQALHHGSSGAATIICQAFIHIPTAVTIALPT